MSEMTKLCKEFKQIENVALIVGCAMFAGAALIPLYFAGWWIWNHPKPTAIMVGFTVTWFTILVWWRTRNHT